MAGDVIRAAVLDRMPEIKMGWKATAMERRREKPVQTERGDQLRAIKQENAQRKTWIEQITSMKEKVRQIAARAARLLAFNRAQETEAEKVEGERQRRAEQAAK